MQINSQRKQTIIFTYVYNIYKACARIIIIAPTTAQTLRMRLMQFDMMALNVMRAVFHCHH